MSLEFKKCLKIGQVFEKKAQLKLIEYYKSKYNVLNECNTYHYDFMLSNNKKYEVKYCSLSNCGDSVFLETFAYNKPSGINKTEANYYIFVIKNNNIFVKKDILLFIKIKAKKLKFIIQKQLFNNYYQDKMKEGFIISIDVIKQFGKIISK